MHWNEVNKSKSKYNDKIIKQVFSERRNRATNACLLWTMNNITYLI